MSIVTCQFCGEPIHESAEICPHCGGERPDATPGASPEPNLDLVPVFRTGDAGLIALAKSLLDGEGIQYMARGDGLQDLIGGGRLGGGFNYVVGPVEFVVRSDDAPRVRALLEDLANAGESGPSDAPE